MRVEKATLQHISAWLDLADEVGELFGANMAGDPGFHDWLKRSIDRGAAFCVRIDGELAGAMQFRNGWIHWLAVCQRFRRRGVGRALVAYAITASEQMVRVTTFGEGHPHPDAAAARALYYAMGFVTTGETPETVADGTPREVLLFDKMTNEKMTGE